MNRIDNNFITGQFIGHDNVSVMMTQKKSRHKKMVIALVVLVILVFIGQPLILALAVRGAVDEFIDQPKVSEVNKAWEIENHGTKEWIQYKLDSDPEFRADYKKTQTTQKEEMVFVF